MYDFLRRILFVVDPERIHYVSMNTMRLLCSIPYTRKIIEKRFRINALIQQKKIWGITFRNPVGLAAGFDKNAKYLDVLNTLGFGFVEVGTVTPKPQAGNQKPRLFRLPKDKALINRMGFNNDGVKAVADRLRKWRIAENPGNRGIKLIIGGNIGKNKLTPNEVAWKDYELCFRELFDCVDYFVVNVSSPNTPGLRKLQDKRSLKKILSHLQAINQQQVLPKPILLKIAPDLTIEQLDDVIDLALEIKLDGLVATNTTINKNGLETTRKELETIGSGGLSGKPLKKMSTDIVRYIYKQSNGVIPIIAAGGIFTGEDANQKMNAGAALVQVWTGFIYEGPSIVKNICISLSERKEPLQPLKKSS